MSDPIPDPGPTGPVGGAPPDEVAALEAELANGSGDRLARYAGRARTACRALAVLIVATGITALVIGLVGWRTVPVVLVLVVLFTLPAIVLPIYVARRTSALATAAAQPREVAAQARDLVTRVRDSHELRALADRLALLRSGRPAATGSIAAPKGGRFRQGLSLARLASTVIGQASPDDDRHALLVPFTPERLGRTWAALVWSLWAWLAAVLVLAFSIPALVVSLF